MTFFFQDWAGTEAGLHRALAAYVKRRAAQNDGPRPDAVARNVPNTYSFEICPWSMTSLNSGKAMLEWAT